MLCLGLLTASTASAYSFSAENGDGVAIYYEINEDGTTVSVTFNDFEYAPYAGDVVIPETVSNDGVTYDVTGIAFNAFAYCSELASVTMAPSITTIGERAFEGCNILNAITIPASVASIGEMAFFGCSFLRAVTVDNADPANIVMGDNVFMDIDLGSATLYVPRGCRDLYANAPQWQGFGKIVASAYDFAVTDASGSLIYYVTNADGETVTVTHDGEYNSYSGDIVIPRTVTYNGVTYTVTTIGEYAFGRSKGLNSVVIPSTVTVIEDSAFSTCTNLTSVTIPASVETIGYRAFYDCSNLPKIVIPASVRSLGEQAFEGCLALSVVVVENDDPANIAMGDRVFCNLELYACSLYVPKGRSEPYVAADQWSDFGNIGEYAYDFSSENEDGVIIYYEISPRRNASATVTYEYAGAGGYEGEVIIPTTVVRDGVTYPVTAIAENAFYGCTELTAVTIPASIASIGTYAFKDCSCLWTVNVENDDPANITLGEEVFQGLPSAPVAAPSKLYVPKGSKALYEAAPQWGDFQVIVERGYDFAAKNAHGVTIYYNINADGKSVTVTYKEEGGVSYVGAVDIPRKVTYEDVTYAVTAIGESAFECPAGAASISAVFIPSTVTFIGNHAFRGCFALLEVTVKNSDPSTVALGADVFIGTPTNTASALSTLYVPTGSKELYAAAPQWCDFMMIEEVDFPADGPDGDTNGDGVVDASDIAYVIDSLLGFGHEVFNPDEADLNGDGVVDATDISLIIHRILNN